MGRSLGLTLALLVLIIPVAAGVLTEAPARAAVVVAAADDPAGSPLETARSLYADARFDEAARLLREGLTSGRFTGGDVIAAKELLARSLVRAGNRVEGKEAFKSILRQDPQYRADPLRLPPEELEVFRAAKREVDAEQLEQGRRVPASVSVEFGRGNSTNEELANLALARGGGTVEFDGNTEFGGSVRFPIKPRLSIDLELFRLQATEADNLPGTDREHATFTASALPLVANLVWVVRAAPRWRVNAVGGVGLMLVSQAVLQYQHEHFGRLIPVEVVGEGTGPYLQGGLEGEFLVIPRGAITARVLGRYANSGGLEWRDPDFEFYEGYPDSRLGTDRTVDFSGIAFNVGLRAYIGY